MRKTAEVRNPLLILPATQKLKNLLPEAKLALREVLQELAEDVRNRAEYSWRKGKQFPYMQITSR